MIEYKLLKSGMTENIYPQQVNSQSFTKKELQEKLEKKYGAIASVVADSVFDMIRERLGNGDTVSIDGFGTFTLRLGMSQSDIKNYEEVRSQDIRIKGVRFKAAQKLRNSLGSNHIHLIDGDKVRRALTTDDRWVRLYDYILSQHNEQSLPEDFVMVTTSIYMHLSGCSRHTADKELKQFVQEGKLRVMTSKRNKFYMLRNS